jgi:acetolactate synthase I/II/III large subunit
VMAAIGHVEAPQAAVLKAPAPASPAEIAAAAVLLVKARRPMIMTGSGAQHASASIRALAEELDAPVAAFRGGRGVMPEDHDLGISSVAARDLWPETDAVVGIGTRLEMPTMRWTGMMTVVDRPVAPPHIIRIDIDPAEMHRLAAHAGIVADADVGTKALLAELRRLKSRKSAATSYQIRTQIAATKRAARKKIDVVQPQMAYLDIIRDCLPRDGILVGELSQVGFTSYFGYPVYQPYTYITEGYQGTLGFGFPTALGVKVAHPDQAVVSITGDGGFMFAMQELATAKQEAIALVVLLFNNRSYGNVMRDQKTNFGNRIIGAELENPDFMMLGQAFGIETHRVGSPESLAPVLAKALGAGKPVLIEIDVARGSDTSPWDFIHARL